MGWSSLKASIIRVRGFGVSGFRLAWDSLIKTLNLRPLFYSTPSPVL